MSDAYPRYLAAKRTVDDRALNRHVLDALRRTIPCGTAGAPIRVLEIGCGTGTMVMRAVEWGLLAHAEYTAMDGDAGGIAAARRLLPAWARARGWSSTTEADGALLLAGADSSVRVRLIEGDLRSFAAKTAGWDLVIANAVLDLVDVPSTLPQVWGWLRPGGWFWFTINFDGETILLPEVDPALDAEITTLYHRSMDERVIDGHRSGDSHTGRNLFAHLRASGARVLAAGASDWVVHAVEGRYPADEDIFLRHIIDTMHQELSAHPALDADRFRDWIDARRRQIDRGEMVYIAHQLDFFGRSPGGAGG